MQRTITFILLVLSSFLITSNAINCNIGARASTAFTSIAKADCPGQCTYDYISNENTTVWGCNFTCGLPPQTCCSTDNCNAQNLPPTPTSGLKCYSGTESISGLFAVSERYCEPHHTDCVVVTDPILFGTLRFGCGVCSAIPPFALIDCCNTDLCNTPEEESTTSSSTTSTTTTQATTSSSTTSTTTSSTTQATTSSSTTQATSTTSSTQASSTTSSTTTPSTTTSLSTLKCYYGSKFNGQILSKHIGICPTGLCLKFDDGIQTTWSCGLICPTLGNFECCDEDLCNSDNVGLQTGDPPEFTTNTDSTTGGTGGTTGGTTGNTNSGTQTNGTSTGTLKCYFGQSVDGVVSDKRVIDCPQGVCTKIENGPQTVWNCDLLCPGLPTALCCSTDLCNSESNNNGSIQLQPFSFLFALIIFMLFK